MILLQSPRNAESLLTSPKFRDQWIEQGLEGGRRAALALEDAVRARCGEHGDGVEVVVKVVANVDGLAKILDRDVSDIRGFALGFTQAKASFDFIIVGPENGTTTAKVRGLSCSVCPSISRLAIAVQER